MESQPNPKSKFTVNCSSCKGKIDPAEPARTLYTDDYVRIVLRTDNQCWLGRCIIVPLEHVSPRDLWTSGWLLTRMGQYVNMLNTVYRDLYGMSVSNVAQLGNLTVDEHGAKTADDAYHHTHFHFIPRYEHMVERYGIRFTDPQWGRALNIDPKAGLPVYELSDVIIAAIVSDIRAAIEKCPQRPQGRIVEYA